MSWDRSTGCPFHCFSLCVVQHPVTKLFLAVEEKNNRGWWLPGGFVENGDNHFSTAHKETIEEAGMDIVIKGILRIENSMTSQGGRQRVIFYCHPLDNDAPCKSVADEESISSAWVSLDWLQERSTMRKPQGLRGSELLDWARYLEAGGPVYPVSVLATEHDAVKVPE